MDKKHCIGIFLFIVLAIVLFIGKREPYTSNNLKRDIINELGSVKNINNNPLLKEVGLIREAALATNLNQPHVPISTTMAIPWDPGTKKNPVILLAKYDDNKYVECLNSRQCIIKNRNGIKIPIKWLPLTDQDDVSLILIINNVDGKIVTKKITAPIPKGTLMDAREGINTIELRVYYDDGGDYYLMSNPLIVNVE